MLSIIDKIKSWLFRTKIPKVNARRETDYLAGERADSSKFQLQMAHTSYSAGSAISASIVFQGLPLQRGVVVCLERHVLRDDRLITVSIDHFSKVVLKPYDSQQAQLDTSFIRMPSQNVSLDLPDDAFTYEGTQVKVRWAVVAHELGGQELAWVGLQVTPAVRSVQDCAAAQKTLRFWRSIQLLKEIRGLIPAVLVILFCMALPLFATFFRPPHREEIDVFKYRMLSLLTLPVAWMFLYYVVWPQLSRWYSLMLGSKLDVSTLRCGETLHFTAPPHYPEWKFILVERSENFFRGRTSSGSTYKGTRIKEHIKKLTYGQGEGSIILATQGPPSFRTRKVALEYEIQFFHPQKPTKIVVTRCTVLPARI